MAFTTNDGISIPDFMYGTAWKKENTTRLVELAVNAGFKAIDTANQLIHYDEVRVGQALLNLQKSGITRADLFLQTKFTSVNGQDHRTLYDASASITKQVEQSIDSSLSHLHTDYVDSYVLHGPYSRNGLGAEDFEAWAAIETLHRAGKSRMIGISNVDANQLRILCEKSAVKPMMVQNRCYAITGWDWEVRQLCKQHNIIYQGFSLLTANGQVASSSLVKEIAKRLHATFAQVIFSFSLRVGMLPITGTSSELHMSEDLLSYRYELSDDEIEQIEKLLIR